MSVDRCRCGNLVDTDFEPEAYVDVAPGETVCLCKSCRVPYEEDEE